MFENIRELEKKEDKEWQEKVMVFRKDYEAFVEKHGIALQPKLDYLKDGIVATQIPMPLPGKSDIVTPPSGIIKPFNG